MILQSCLLRLPLASGRLEHVEDLTHVHVGFDGTLRFFFFLRERDLLTLIFVVNGAVECLSTSSVNRVFCVWVRGHIPAASCCLRRWFCLGFPLLIRETDSFSEAFKVAYVGSCSRIFLENLYSSFFFCARSHGALVSPGWS